MQTTAAAAPFFLPFVLPICLWVTWSDLARMKIPNYAVMALAAVFIVIGPFVLPLGEYGWRVLNGVILFFVGWLATSVRLMGAGDAKFIAAAAPFVPPTFAGLVQIIWIFVPMLLLTFALHRLVRAIPAVRNLAPDWKSWTSKKFPMGVTLSFTLAFLLIRAAFRI